MIVTDPLKRPSERLIQIVSDYFLPKGFLYKKSKNQFNRTIANRTEMVSIFYNTTGHLVCATLTWTILFPSLEKIYKVIDPLETKGIRDVTLWNDLLNYSQRFQNDDPYEFKLYDTPTLKYDDFSLNAGSVMMIESYEKYIETYFDHFKDLKNLENNLNELPLHHHSHIGYGGRQIAFGLILSNLFNKANYDHLVDLYYQYIMKEKEREEFRNKMERIFKTTVSYLNTVDINKIILH